MNKNILFLLCIVALNLFAKERITAVIPNSFPPYYIINDKNKADGFAIELLNSIAKEVDLEVEYIVKDSFNEANEIFTSKKADLIPNSGINAKRKKNSIFTSTTDTFRILAFKRVSSENITTLDQIKDKKVVVLKGNIAVELMKNHPKELLIIKNSNKEALFELLSGEVDVLIYPEIPTLNILKKLNLEDKIIPFGEALKEVKRAIRVQKDNPKLALKLDLGLSKLKESGEYHKIYTKWFGSHDTVEIEQSFLNKIYSSAILMLVMLIVLLFFLFRTLQLKKSVTILKNRFLNMFTEHDSIMLLIEPKSGKIIDANKSALKFYGYSKNEMLNLNIDKINTLSPKELKKQREEAFSNKNNMFEFSHKLKNGTIKVVEVHSSTIENEKGIVLFSIIEDVSERKIIEKKVKDQNIKLLTLKNNLDNAINAASLGLWEWDLINDITTWSDITYDMYGVNRNYPLNIKFVESLIHKEDLQIHRENIQKSLTEDLPINFEYRIIKDNEIRTIHAIGKTIKEAGKVIKLTGVVQDITNIKENEKELLSAQEIAKIGHYEFDIANNSFKSSFILDSIFGVPKNYKKTFETWIELIYEDDRQMMSKYFKSIIEKRVDFDKEYRIIDYTSKEIKWVHGLGVIRYDKYENPVKMFGTVQNINDRKIYESQMKQALSVFKNTNEGIMLTSSDNKIINVNPAFIKTTGYELNDVVGKTPAILKSFMYSKDFYKNMWEKIRNEGFWQGEITNKRKNGQFYEEYLTINAIKDKNGKIENYIGIFSDISVLKHQEKMILQQARTSAIGEMIGNIAHQWRQPLSVISTASTGMKLQLEIGSISQEDISNTLDKINQQSQYLSKTIEDFRGFFTEDISKVTEFNISQAIEKVEELTKDSFSNNFIEIKKDIDEEVYIYANKNLLIQALINIFNNAKDVLTNNKENENRLLFISVKEENSKIIIKIKDNGGGIAEENLERIFDPYFTTKHQSQGTGLGLYMTNQIISKQLHGSIHVSNTKYEYEGSEYLGACFLILI